MDKYKVKIKRNVPISQATYDWYTDYGMDQLYGGTVMKLIGNLKKQVEKAESKQEKKSLIENAGMLLSDDELENVAGGKSKLFDPYEIYCAGVVACNGKMITPGCDFKESHPSRDSAIQIMTKKYNKKCIVVDRLFVPRYKKYNISALK